MNVDDDAHRVWRAPVPSANFNCRAADIDDEDLHGLLEVCVECSATTGAFLDPAPIDARCREIKTLHGRVAAVAMLLLCLYVLVSSPDRSTRASRAGSARLLGSPR